MELVDRLFGTSSLREFTVECNPDDVTTDYMRSLARLGVNRISMGVQSFHNATLQFMGRRHDAIGAGRAVHSCRDAGIENVSIDLMYGLPGQTLPMLQYDVECALALGVNHISAYCLSYEEGSPLERMRQDGRVQPVSDELCAAMYELVCSMLKEAGMEHYELSNFAKSGCRSLHNSSYWNGTPYLGVGAGAHSYNGQSRQWAPSDLDLYMEGLEQGSPTFEVEELTADNLYNEMVMLRLRTNRGIEIDSLSQEWRKRLLGAATHFVNSGSMVLSQGFLSIPESSMFISDAIISELIV